MEKISNVCVYILAVVLLALSVGGCHESNSEKKAEPRYDFILLSAHGDTIMVLKDVQDLTRNGTGNTVYVLDKEGKKHVINGGIQIKEEK